MKKVVVSSLVVLLSTAFVACNGGGGGGGGTPVTPTPPKDGKDIAPEPGDKPAPVAPKNLRHSSQKLELFKKLKEAGAQDKYVLVLLTAADSAESVLLEEKVANSSSDIGQVLGDKFITAKFDRMFFHNAVQTLDFLPGGTATYFPSAYVIDPSRNNKWAVLSVDVETVQNSESSEKKLTQVALEEFMAEGTTSKVLVSRLNELLDNKNSQFKLDTDEGRRNLLTATQALFAAAVESDSHNLLQELSEKLDSFESKYKSNVDATILGAAKLRAWQILVGRNILGYESVISNLDAEAKLISATAALAFYAPVSAKISASSPKDAASSCNVQLKKWREEYKADAIVQTSNRKEKAELELAKLNSQLDEAKANEDGVAVWDLRKKIAVLSAGIDVLDNNLNHAETEMAITCLALRYRAGMATSAQVSDELGPVKTLAATRTSVSILQAISDDFSAATITRQALVNEQIAKYDANIDSISAEIVDLPAQIAALEESQPEKAEALKTELKEAQAFIDMNQKLKVRVTEAFAKLKSAWSAGSIIVNE